MNSSSSGLILEHLQKEASKLMDAKSVDWAMKPDPLDVFIKKHLNLEPFSARQYQDVMCFLGSDPQQVFNGGVPFNTMCMLAGKGSGKDYVGSIVVCYILYILLCLRNPQTFLGQSPISSIDIIIVSYSQKQALEISFQYIKQVINKWHWLKSKYSLIIGDKYVNGKGKPEIVILNDMLTTYNNIRIISQHSANESYEGYNILMWIMSEASAFKSHSKERNGEKVFSTLKSSATSRFKSRWKGMVMSFPRYDEENDFTYVLYKSRLKDKTIYGTMGATWEFNPRGYSGSTFEYKGVQIPIEHQSDFESVPEESERKYLCWPGKGGAEVFDEDIIMKGVIAKTPLFTVDEYVAGDEVKAYLGGIHGVAPGTYANLFVHDYLLTVDLGKVSSAAAIALQHIEEGVYILDAIGTWTPDPDKGIKVDLIDVKDRLFELAKAVPRIRIGFDQWQSILFTEELRQAGIKTLTYHTVDNDYFTFKKGIALGKAKILDNQALITQLNSLRDNNGKINISKLISFRKDMVDVVVGGFKVLMSETKATELPGWIITSNIEQFGIVLPDS